jgi:hypothetical protein
MNDNQRLVLIIVAAVGISFLLLFAVRALADSTEPTKADESKRVTIGTIAQEFNHDPTRKISAIIGSKSQTRISFCKVGIREVVGDNNKYSMVHDTLGMSIFISPKVKLGETINLTVISNGGKFQDLSLLVTDSEGKVILISDNKSATEEPLPSKTSIGAQKFIEAKEMLKAMVLGVRGKYAVTDFVEDAKAIACAKCSPSRVRGKKGKKSKEGILVAFIPLQDKDSSDKSLVGQNSVGQGLEIRETHVYKYKLSKLQGIVLEIKNKTKKPWEVSADLLNKMFRGVVLTNIETQIIPANTSVQSFCVMNDTEEA